MDKNSVSNNLKSKNIDISDIVPVSTKNINEMTGTDSSFPTTPVNSPLVCTIRNEWSDEKNVPYCGNTNACNAFSQNLLEDVPSSVHCEDNSSKSQNDRLTFSAKNGRFSSAWRTFKTLFIPFSVLLNIVLVILVVLNLLQSGNPHDPLRQHRPKNFDPKFDSSICLSSEIYNGNSTLEVKTVDGTKLYCFTDVKHLQWLLRLMMAEKAVTKIKRSKRFPKYLPFHADAAHVSVFSRCPKTGCKPSSPLFLDNSYCSDYRCGSIEVSPTNVKITRSGMYLVYAQLTINYDLHGERTYDDDFSKISITAAVVKNSSSNVVTSSVPYALSTGRQSLELFRIGRMTMGDTLIPKLSDTTLFHNFSAINHFGVVALSYEEPPHAVKSGCNITTVKLWQIAMVILLNLVFN